MIGDQTKEYNQPVSEKALFLVQTLKMLDLTSVWRKDNCVKISSKIEIRLGLFLVYFPKNERVYCSTLRTFRLMSIAKRRYDPNKNH
jgi:hypothetical protein